MSISKEKLMNRINQDIKNAEETIEHVLRSKNYHVAAELKFAIDYIRGIKWDIEDGKFDRE